MRTTEAVVNVEWTRAVLGGCRNTLDRGCGRAAELFLIQRAGAGVREIDGGPQQKAHSHDARQPCQSPSGHDDSINGLSRADTAKAWCRLEHFSSGSLAKRTAPPTPYGYYERLARLRSPQRGDGFCCIRS